MKILRGTAAVSEESMPRPAGCAMPLPGQSTEVKALGRRVAVKMRKPEDLHKTAPAFGGVTKKGPKL